MIKTGAALTGGGLMVAAVGMGLAAVALARSAMIWSKQHDAAAVLAAKLEQAKHASAAGVHAWREHVDAEVDGRRAAHAH